MSVQSVRNITIIWNSKCNSTNQQKRASEVWLLLVIFSYERIHPKTAIFMVITGKPSDWHTSMINGSPVCQIANWWHCCHLNVTLRDLHFPVSVHLPCSAMIKTQKSKWERRGVYGIIKLWIHVYIRKLSPYRLTYRLESEVLFYQKLSNIIHITYVKV